MQAPAQKEFFSSTQSVRWMEEVFHHLTGFFLKCYLKRSCLIYIKPTYTLFNKNPVKIPKVLLSLGYRLPRWFKISSIHNRYVITKHYGSSNRNNNSKCNGNMMTTQLFDSEFRG